MYDPKTQDAAQTRLQIPTSVSDPLVCLALVGGLPLWPELPPKNAAANETGGMGRLPAVLLMVDGRTSVPLAVGMPSSASDRGIVPSPARKAMEMCSSHHDCYPTPAPLSVNAKHTQAVPGGLHGGHRAQLQTTSTVLTFP